MNLNPRSRRLVNLRHMLLAQLLWSLPHFPLPRTFGMDEIWMISASAHALGLTTPDFKYPGAGFASDCSDDIEAIR